MPRCPSMGDKRGILFWLSLMEPLRNPLGNWAKIGSTPFSQFSPTNIQKKHFLAQAEHPFPHASARCLQSRVDVFAGLGSRLQLCAVLEEACGAWSSELGSRAVRCAVLRGVSVWRSPFKPSPKKGSLRKTNPAMKLNGCALK